MAPRCLRGSSPQGFVQQLASCYLRHGYFFFVQGEVPAGREPSEIDRKLLGKFGIELTTAQRRYRKRQGIAGVHYRRHDRQWIMVATHGRHVWWDEHHHDDRARSQVKDARLVPIHFRGYSLRVRRGEYLRKRPGEERARPDGRLRVRVLIGREAFRVLKAEFLDLALRRSADYLAVRFRTVPFEPYAPIRKQLLDLFRLVNASRKAAGLDQLRVDCIRMRRRIVKPFDAAQHYLRGGYAEPAPGREVEGHSKATGAVPCQGRCGRNVAL